MTKGSRRWGWRFDLALLTVYLITLLVFGLIFLYSLNSSPNLDPVAIREISSTVVVVNATLFGLSSLSTALYVNATKRRKEKPEILLQWEMMACVGASFLTFIVGLLAGFVSLFTVDRSTLAMSMAGTVGGASLGSLEIILVLRDYMSEAE